MGLAEELPVYKKSYDLLLQLFELTRHFKGEYKLHYWEHVKE